MLDLTGVWAQTGFLERLLARQQAAGCHVSPLGFSIHSCRVVILPSE